MARVVLEPEAQVGRGEKIGDFADGVVARWIVIGHERSPIETTHNDLRLTVDALSGGLPFTIYAARLESVRLGPDNFSSVLTNYRNRTGDGEKVPLVRLEVGTVGGSSRTRDETERRESRRTSASCALLARRCRQPIGGNTL